MPRIKALDMSDADPKAQKQLEGVKKGLGTVPNIMATMAHSPAVLQAYLSFGQALGDASLSGAVREQIAMAVAGENACGYCASAHTALGKKAGVAEDELARNLRGESSDSRVQAAIDFSRAIVAKKGWIDDADLASARDAGFSDTEIVEIVAIVAINLFTNYFNHVVDTKIDFPEVAMPEPVTR